MEITSKIRELIEKDLVDAGYILDDVLYEKEGKIYFLRIVIDKTTPVTVDDCVIATGIINPIIDKADIIKESYILDVSSKEKGC